MSYTGKIDTSSTQDGSCLIQVNRHEPSCVLEVSILPVKDMSHPVC